MYGRAVANCVERSTQESSGFRQPIPAGWAGLFFFSASSTSRTKLRAELLDSGVIESALTGDIALLAVELKIYTSTPTTVLSPPLSCSTSAPIVGSSS